MTRTHLITVMAFLLSAVQVGIKMGRMFFAAIIIGGLVLSSVSFGYSGGSGTGTVEDPYQIATKADLLALAATTADYGKCFILTADINLDPNLPGGQVFTTAVISPNTETGLWGFQGVKFTGVFDGARHKIINLTINTHSTDNHFLGLFGYVSSGNVKNLGLENVSITGGYNSRWLGGLAGCFGGPAENGGSISNCYSTGAVSGGWLSLGGLVGSNGYYGTISNCYSTVAVTRGDVSSQLGGLVGGNGGSIINCYSTGAVTGGNDSRSLGGLVGENNSGNISNCFSTGAVTGGDNSYSLGGLAGANTYTGSISSCYSTGNVTGGDNSYNLAGLAGYNKGDSISNCYSTGDVTGGVGSYYLGGLVGTNDYSDVNNCYSTGAVTGGNDSRSLGGLVGYNYQFSYYPPGTISSCYFLVTSGPDNGLGTPLTDAQMKQKSSFVGWDFDTVWDIIEGVSYPWLREVPPPVERIILSVPFFSQQDPRWENKFLDHSSASIGIYGCALTSLSMVLRYFGMDTDPNNLNDVLTAISAIDTDGNIYFEKVPLVLPDKVLKYWKLDTPSMNDTALATITSQLKQRNPVIAEVRTPNGTPHFIVIYGKVGGQYVFHDPADENDTYREWPKGHWGNYSLVSLRMYEPHSNGLSIYSDCPVDLLVTDPDGQKIGKYLNEITDAIYGEFDVSSDGDLDDVIIIPTRKPGDYFIEIVPEPNASLTDTYSLKVASGGQTLVLAQDVQIQDVPQQPYVFVSRLNPSDFDADGDVDFYDYAAFASRWMSADCHYPDWCEGTDLDYSGHVDFMDLSIFTKNWLWEKIPADIDIDGDVDFVDYAVFANHWMNLNCAEPNWCYGADLDKSGSVDLYDLAEFAEYWLEGTLP